MSNIIFPYCEGKTNNITANVKEFNYIVRSYGASQKIIDENELDDMGYQKRWGVYRVRLNKNDLEDKKERSLNCHQLY